MKDWFQKLDKKIKMLIHIVLAIIIWIIIPCSSNDSTPDLLYLFWIGLITIEIVLTVWSVKSKKIVKNENNSSAEQSQPVSSTVVKKVEVQPFVKTSNSISHCEQKVFAINNENLLKVIQKIA